MATTSPDNLRTPNPGDSYNLVPDLATLANDVQAALLTRSARFGTAAQRGAFLSTAPTGFIWQDTDDIGMIWKRGASTWVPAVWRWAGTTSQMNAFTQAPNGFEWFNTTDNSEYIRLGGVWRIDRQGGSNILVKAAATANVSYPLAITFPQAFGAVPNVQATASATSVEGLPFVAVGNVTATGFTANMTHNFATRDLRMNWSASLV